MKAGSNAELIAVVRKGLKAQADPERAQGQGDYMKVALPFLGVALPDVRKLAKQALRDHPLNSAAEYRASIEGLFFDAEFQEERYACMEITNARKCRSFQGKALLPLYRRMIQTAAWWDLVDDLSCRVGDILLGEPDAVGAELLRWARGKDIWLRRTAIICQRKHKQATDVSLLLACIEPSLGESEFFLRKGIGWALRALSETEPDTVIRYVREHKDELSPLSKKEAFKTLLKTGKVRSVP